MADADWQSLAESQFGCITRDQLLMFASEWRIKNLLSKGFMRKVGRSTYVVRGAPASWMQDAKAVTMSISNSAIGFEAAVWLHGFALYKDCAPTISVVTESSHHEFSIQATVHRTVQLCGFVEVVDNIPVTSVARTLIDLTSEIGRPRLRALLHNAMAKNLVTHQEILQCLDQMRTKGRHRTRKIRAILGEEFPASEAFETHLERRIFGEIVNAAIEAPVPHHKVQTVNALYDIDLAFVAERIAIEVDGPVHDSPDQIKRDQLRDADLWQTGWAVFRIRYSDSPAEYLARLRNLLREQRQRIA